MPMAARISATATPGRGARRERGLRNRGKAFRFPRFRVVIVYLLSRTTGGGGVPPGFYGPIRKIGGRRATPSAFLARLCGARFVGRGGSRAPGRRVAGRAG